MSFPAAFCLAKVQSYLAEASFENAARLAKLYLEVATQEQVDETFTCLREYEIVKKFLQQSEQFANLPQGRLLIAQTNFHLHAFEDCLEAGGDYTAELCFWKARAALELDLTKKATKLLTKAIGLDPLHSECWALLRRHSLLAPDHLSSLAASVELPPEAEIFRALLSVGVSRYNDTSEETKQNFAALAEAGLENVAEVQLARAQSLFYANDFLAAKALVQASPEPSHRLLLISCLYQLDDRRELFRLGHQMTDDAPDSATAWYCVGAYYLLNKKYAEARRYLGKATTLDALHAPAWLAFAHSFALEGEHDQALVSYRTAARVLPASHLPLLCLGMELCSVNNLLLAKEFFVKAQQLCPTDPLILNELGVMYYEQENWPEALACFTRAAEVLELLARELDS